MVSAAHALVTPDATVTVAAGTATRAPNTVPATQAIRPAIRGTAAPLVPVSRIVAVRFPAAVRHRSGAFVLVRTSVTHAEPTEQHEQIAAVLLCEQRVQVRIGA